MAYVPHVATMQHVQRCYKLMYIYMLVPSVGVMGIGEMTSLETGAYGNFLGTIYIYLIGSALSRMGIKGYASFK